MSIPQLFVLTRQGRVVKKLASIDEACESFSLNLAGAEVRSGALYSADFVFTVSITLLGILTSELFERDATGHKSDNRRNKELPTSPHALIRQPSIFEIKVQCVHILLGMHTANDLASDRSTALFVKKFTTPMNSSNASRRPAVHFKFLRQVFGMPVLSKNTRPLADRLIQWSCQMINAEANNKVFRGEITPQQEAEQASSSRFDSNQHDAESEDPPSPATLMHDVFDAPSTPPPPAPGTLMYELFYAPLTPLPGEVALPETFVADDGMTSRLASPDFGDDANMAASPDSDSDISYLFRSDPVPQPTTPQLSTTFL
ncbi:hypothetical protein R3P38DRAFT_2765083 [Favolaschia claudopus]|uniref:Uncharacterized protein n=1 Tax=Favolaschia claudopus TaxID=2862362 RepID=A0AAW0D5T5_9AGAR